MQYFATPSKGNKYKNLVDDDVVIGQFKAVPDNVIEDALKVIRDENGSISLGYAL